MRAMLRCGAPALLLAAAVSAAGQGYGDLSGQPAHFMKSSRGPALWGKHFLMRDVQVEWGGKQLWLSEIKDRWGLGATESLYNSLSDDDKYKVGLALYPYNDRKHYFGARIAGELARLANDRQGWTQVQQAQVERRIPDYVTNTVQRIRIVPGYPDVKIDVEGCRVYVSSTQSWRKYREVRRRLQERAATLDHAGRYIAKAKWNKVGNAVRAGVPGITSLFLALIPTPGGAVSGPQAELFARLYELAKGVYDNKIKDKPEDELTYEAAQQALDEIIQGAEAAVKQECEKVEGDVRLLDTYTQNIRQELIDLCKQRKDDTRDDLKKTTDDLENELDDLTPPDANTGGGRCPETQEEWDRLSAVLDHNRGVWSEMGTHRRRLFNLASVITHHSPTAAYVDWRRGGYTLSQELPWSWEYGEAQSGNMWTEAAQVLRANLYSFGGWIERGAGWSPIDEFSATRIQPMYENLRDRLDKMNTIAANINADVEAGAAAETNRLATLDSLLATIQFTGCPSYDRWIQRSKDSWWLTIQKSRLSLEADRNRWRIIYDEWPDIRRRVDEALRLMQRDENVINAVASKSRALGAPLQSLKQLRQRWQSDNLTVGDLVRDADTLNGIIERIDGLGAELANDLDQADSLLTGRAAEDLRNYPLSALRYRSHLWSAPLRREYDQYFAAAARKELLAKTYDYWMGSQHTRMITAAFSLRGVNYPRFTPPRQTASYRRPTRDSGDVVKKFERRYQEVKRDGQRSLQECERLLSDIQKTAEASAVGYIFWLDTYEEACDRLRASPFGSRPQVAAHRYQARIYGDVRELTSMVNNLRYTYEDMLRRVAAGKRQYDADKAKWEAEQRRLEAERRRKEEEARAAAERERQRRLALVKDAARRLVEAYNNKDRRTFIGMVDERFVGNRDELEDAVRKDFETYTFISVRAQVAPNAVGNELWADVSFERELTPRDGKSMRDRGNALLRFSLAGDRVLLMAMRGNALFGATRPPLGTLEHGKPGLEGHPGGHGGPPHGGGPALVEGSATIGNQQGFDFSARRVILGGRGGDVSFMVFGAGGYGEIMAANGLAEMGRTPLSRIKSAPTGAGEYQRNEITHMSEGMSFVIRTEEGHYAKLQVVTVRPNDVEIEYAYQPDGSPNF